MLRLLPTLLLLCLPTVTSAASLAEAAPTDEDDQILSECLSRVNERLANEMSADPSDCISAAANTCMEGPEGATTLGMTACYERETAWWDSRMNESYEELEAELPANTFETLREAQRAWLEFRDADCDFIYQLWHEGTIRSPLHASCLLDHTARRTLELQSALPGE